MVTYLLTAQFGRFPRVFVDLFRSGHSDLYGENIITEPQIEYWIQARRKRTKTGMEAHYLILSHSRG